MAVEVCIMLSYGTRFQLDNMSEWCEASVGTTFRQMWVVWRSIQRPHSILFSSLCSFYRPHITVNQGSSKELWQNRSVRPLQSSPVLPDSPNWQCWVALPWQAPRPEPHTSISSLPRIPSTAVVSNSLNPTWASPQAQRRANSSMDLPN